MNELKRRLPTALFYIFLLILFHSLTSEVVVSADESQYSRKDSITIITTITKDGKESGMPKISIVEIQNDTGRQSINLRNDDRNYDLIAIDTMQYEITEMNKFHKFRPVSESDLLMFNTSLFIYSKWFINPFFDIPKLRTDLDTVFELNISPDIYFDEKYWDKEFLHYRTKLANNTVTIKRTLIDDIEPSDIDTIVLTADIRWTTEYGDFAEDVVALSEYLSEFIAEDTRVQNKIDSIFTSTSPDTWIKNIKLLQNYSYMDIYGNTRDFFLQPNSIINFGFAQCPPCYKLKPILDSIHLAGDINVHYFSVDKPSPRQLDRDIERYDKHEFTYSFGYLDKDQIKGIFKRSIPYPFTIFIDQNGNPSKCIAGYPDDYLFQLSN